MLIRVILVLWIYYGDCMVDGFDYFRLEVAFS